MSAYLHFIPTLLPAAEYDMFRSSCGALRARPRGYIWYLESCKTHAHQVVPFMISSCSSTAHEMLLPNKQAHQQNKLSPHVRAIGENDSGKYKHKQVNKHSVTGLL